MLLGLGIWLRFDAGPVGVGCGLLIFVLLLVMPGFRLQVTWGALAVIVGVAASEMRLHRVDAPVLSEDWRGEVAGRVRIVDATLSGAPRLTLDHVEMEGLAQVPHRVRVALVRGGPVPRVGDHARVRAVLAAPRGPSEPGGFDFSRQAYFDRLGAVGYATGAVHAQAVPDEALALPLRVDRWRGAIADGLIARIDGPEGGIAAALSVGDRRGIPNEVRDNLRDSGLAHLLAISGLHVGLLGGIVYWVIRLALAIPPRISERFAIRKGAAMAALGAVAVYLVMSGASVATQRAFIMASVALLAIVFDRAAVTMRGLAVAAGIILVLRPESLFEAGFQMSFAAAAALVAGYDATRGFWRARAMRRGIGARFVTGVMATAMTSVLAGFATAPFAAYHFNRLVIWGLPANLLATPLMGLWIMPCIVLAAVLAPVGLEGIALALLGVGIGVVLDVAQGFGGLDGAVSGVVAASPLALLGIVAGGLWVMIWRGGIRLAGGVPVLVGLAFWAGEQRPDLFIARDAALIAGRAEEGRVWVSRARAEGYTAQTWLRRDGEARPDREAAYLRREWSCTARRCRGWTGDDWRIVFLRKGDIYPRDCTGKTVVIAPHLSEREGLRCLLLGRKTLNGASSLSLTFPQGAAPVVRTARPWRKRALQFL